MRRTRRVERSTVASALVVVLALVVSSEVDAATESPSESASVSPSAPRTYEIVDLGALPGANSSEALGINDRGAVVGWSDVGNGVSHAFRWHGGEMTDLGSLIGPSGSSLASDINNRGEIAGSSSASPTETHAVVWRDGEIVDLGTLGGDFARAHDINDRGDVVGISSTAAGDFHAFLWRRGAGMVDLGTVEGQSFSEAHAVNNRGQVVGESGGPVVWRRGVATPLPLVPGAESGAALDNNDRGDVVGYSLMPGGASINRAVIWRRGVPIDLGLERGSSQALGVNNRGQVVGWRELEPLEGTNAYVWHRGQVIDLPSLIGPLGGGASDINNRGEIVGTSPVPGDPIIASHAVLWR